MISLDPAELSIPERHHYLLGGVGPRPIAFASTIDSHNRPNLAPFSFFNVFSSNPPVLIFSPARSGRTGQTKNTLDNVKEVNEVVINVVTYDMVHQMSLASSPYEKGVNEFEKAGFTPIKSNKIKPFRVAESPIQFECKVLEIKELGQKGGAGNLIICEVVQIHINEDIINKEGRIDQTKIDLVSRMGGNWYCRANGDALFEIDKPITTIGIGVDSLPNKIRLSHELSGNDLGKLGNMLELPSSDVIEKEINSMNDVEMTLSNAKNLLNSYELLKAYAILSKVL
ncbi:MAG: flavin reductase family protein [Bacteroidia bacterium]|nr:flavin reductase family protein [Bacteroidia bacterium]NNJ55711.1 flavin reductase family protein [Bacteroidia bacterium]